MSKLLQDVSIGDNLRRFRKAKGLTQFDICAQMTLIGRPMVQSTYAQIETGKRNIFVSDLIALTQILGVSFDDFFGNLTFINKYDD